MQTHFQSIQIAVVTKPILHGLFGLAGHGGEGVGIHHTFITLVLFEGFELNLVQ